LFFSECLVLRSESGGEENKEPDVAGSGGRKKN
jgi:hypothetical protein